MKPIPFFDLSAQNVFLKKELDRAWHETVSSNAFILGPAVADFEKAFARFTGSQEAVGVSSGLDALTLALKAAGIGSGDEVVVPANTFIATALAVSSAGATPLLADVDPETLLLRASDIERVLTPRTKAVIPVHLYGQPADMAPILALSRKKGLTVVEDACQAHGAKLDGKNCGTFGKMGCFSFYPGKNLGAFGDGGLIVTDDAPLAKKLRLLRNYGSTEKYRHEVPGFNMRLDTLQARILHVKLRHLKNWNLKRAAIAARYDRQLKNCKELTVLPNRKGALNAYHLYIVRTGERDALKDYLAKKEIGTGIHYPVPIHYQEAYSGQFRRGAFPVSEQAAREVLSLPLYPEMSPKNVDRVVQAIRLFFKL